ncbi:MAG TPA: SDR family NAD(P)-dependent oxidoreductase [Solirubrobacterales bacterium]|nr:SDR family NAD(P)-dependent oxidoreductase [Solirubrobacterales bacterium]
MSEAVAGRTVLVTGAAGGIGRALALAAVAGGARVLATDVAAAGLGRLSAELGEGHLCLPCDLRDAEAIVALVATATDRLGPIDICFCNAGVAIGTDPMATSAGEWEDAMAVNVGAHVAFARELLPGWLGRGRGHFVSTASAAGLLTQIGSAPYTVTKHAAVAFAEWLAVTYGDRGVKVKCLCPMGVETAMLGPVGLRGQAEEAVRAAGDVLTEEAVAAQVFAELEGDSFLILPHAEVGLFFRRKAEDHDRWLAGMQRLRRTVEGV